MSAFIVSNRQINAILDYINKDRSGHHLYVNGHALNPNNHEHLTMMAQILINENYKSVNYCYSKNDQPHKIVWKPTFTELSPIEVLKLCQCYLYQIGETDNYKSSAAAQIIDQIMTTAITNLPGYNDAKWSIGD